MTAVAVALLLATVLFASLYAACRENVGDLRIKLSDAYRQRDEAEDRIDEAEQRAEDAEAWAKAAEAKADYLAGALPQATQRSFMADEDAFLLSVEADLDSELHGLAALFEVHNELAEPGDVPDIAEEA